jgi:amino acid transporter
MIRRHGSRPTIALWMLVAIADVALVVAAAGALVVTLAVVGALIMTGIVAGALLLQRRTMPQQESVFRRRA